MLKFSLRCFSLIFIFTSVGTSAFAQVDLSAESYPLRSDWSESDGSINISSFVFQDRNRNGIYDIGDKSFSGIFVALGKDNQPVTAARTNVNGFANFKADAADIEMPLSTKGMYDFVVVPPPGWFVTTGNSAQRRELVEISGSIAGLGLVEMTHPVGLSPYTFVRGTIMDADSMIVDVLIAEKIVASAPIHDDGQFLVPLEPGSYTLRTGESNRAIAVGIFPLDIGTFANIETVEVSTQSVNFDDLAASGLQKIPNSYADLNWFNLNALSASFTSGGVGYQNGATSGHNVVYTSSGHPAEISRSRGFNFHSVMLTLAWPAAEGETAIFEYYRGEELVLTDRISVSAFSPIEYAPMMSNVDRVVIRSEHYWQLVLDDLVVSFTDD